jgi:ATP-binding cassette subfamily B protein
MGGSVKKRTFYRVLAYMRGNMGVYIPAVLADGILTSVCFNIVIAFILKNVFDAAINQDKDLLVNGVALAAGAFVLGAALQPMAKYLTRLCVKKTMTRFRMDVFSHLGDLEVAYYERKHSGELISRYTNDLNSVENIYANQIHSLVFTTIHGLIAIAAVFRLEWRMAVGIIILGVASVLVNRLFAFKIRKVSDRLKKEIGVVTERLIDLLSSIRIVKMLHIEGMVHKKYSDANSNLTATSIKNTVLNSVHQTLNFMFSNIKYVGMLGLGLYLVIRGHTEMGTVAAALHLQGNAGYMFDNIGSFIVNIQNSLSGAARVFELLDAPAEKNIIPVPGMEELPAHDGAMIRFEGVSFGYNHEAGDCQDSRGRAVRNVSFSVGRNETVAIVGLNGSGKSTLLKLLMGLYPVPEGRIWVMGKPIEHYTLRQLRDMIAYVPQDAYLFDGTILENIGYGRINASKDEIIEAAKAANAHGFIQDLPEGYETRVGERGKSISGGQKQRIAIARAILKDAPILVLDEATSSLDSESERQAIEALNVLMEGRTTVTVAHRLSAVRDADVIYVMDGGSIVEQGTHEELMMADGLYRRLYTTQARGNIVNKKIS